MKTFDFSLMTRDQLEYLVKMMFDHADKFITDKVAATATPTDDIALALAKRFKLWTPEMAVNVAKGLAESLGLVDKA